MKATVTVKYLRGVVHVTIASGSGNPTHISHGWAPTFKAACELAMRH